MERGAAQPIREPDLPDELHDLEPGKVVTGLTVDGARLLGGVADEEIDEAVWSRSRFEGVQFTGAMVRRPEATDVVFAQCELSGATFEGGTFDRVQFKQCRMSAFSAPDLRATDVSFVDCRLDESWFRMGRLERCLFEHCEMTDADLYASSLVHCRFRSCNLDRLQISQARLDTVAFHGSTVTGIKGADALRSIVIGSDQLVSFAEPIFGALGITIDDEW